MARVAAHGAGWLAWWLACFWLWLLLVGEWNRTELVAAAGAAALAASLAELARAQLHVSFRMPVRVLKSLPSLPLIVLEDFAIIAWALLRSLARREVVRGAYVERPFAGDEGAIAWTELVATVSPNAYVVGVDPERGAVLLHDLVVRRRSEEPA